MTAFCLLELANAFALLGFGKRALCGGRERLGIRRDVDDLVAA
jgi:hypothetical protein